MSVWRRPAGGAVLGCPTESSWAGTVGAGDPFLRTDHLPNDGKGWEYQLKFDGYRAIAFKTGGKIHLRSRNDNDFSLRYADVVKGLAKLPDETVIDGEVIALD